MVMKDLSIKIIDFGDAKIIRDENGEPIFYHEITGKPGYHAPEIFLGNYRGDQVDTYALGVILFLLCFRKYPFEPNNCGETYQWYRSNKDKFWNEVGNVDFDLKELLDLIFEKNPTNRITIWGILQHNWCIKAVPTKAEVEEIFYH